MASTPDRSVIGRIGAHSKWARTPDRTTATAPARAAFMARFEREVDPDGTLPPAERAQRAESARKAYFARLALKSADARQRRAEARTLRALADELDDGAA